MSEWKPIDTAPADTDVIIETRGGNYFRASLQYGISDGEWAWVASNPHVCPPCWTDAVCWASNEDEEPSDPPVRWKPLPTPPERENEDGDE